MLRHSRSTSLLIAGVLVSAASVLQAQVSPAPRRPSLGAPLRQPALPTLPAGQPVPSGLTIAPDSLVIGSAPTLTVTMAGVQTTPTTFKLLSDMVSSWTMTIPAGRVVGTTRPSMPDLPQWQFYNFCVTPDLNESSYPCRNKDAKKALLHPFDANSVQISSFRLNGDNGSGTAIVPRNKVIVVDIRLNAIPPAANILMTADALNYYNRVIYAVGATAGDAIMVPMNLPFGGKMGSGVINAAYNGKWSRAIKILPLQQVDKTCFFDDRPTAGWWSATFDYCTHEINPGQVTGSQTAYGFVRRNFASMEPVYIELSSSDPAVATVSPASASIPNQQRGLTFTVTTAPTGGSPRAVSILVKEGGAFNYTMPLTIQ